MTTPEAKAEIRGVLDEVRQVLGISEFQVALEPSEPGWLSHVVHSDEWNRVIRQIRRRYE